MKAFIDRIKWEAAMGGRMGKEAKGTAFVNGFIDGCRHSQYWRMLNYPDPDWSFCPGGFDRQESLD